MMIKTEAQELAQIRVAMRGAEKIAPLLEPAKLIELALERHGKDKVAVSWSGGRCSTVILHMALQICPCIKVFHIDTGVEYPETVRYVKRLACEWNLNLVIYKPERNFWDIVEKYGFPHMRLASSKGHTSKGKPACCTWLKEKPMMKFRKEHSIEAFITGMRAGEARVRMLIMAQRGQYYFVKKYGLNAWKYNPIAFWSTREVSAYVQEHNIPLNSLYEKLDRSGCWPCTAFVGWKEQLAHTNFKLYKFMMERMNEQRLLDHFYQTRIAPCAERG